MKDWLRLKALPDRVDALEKRLAVLEAGSAGAKADPWACTQCGMRMLVTAEAPDRTWGDFGVKRLTMACPSCLATTEREYDPKKDPVPTCSRDLVAPGVPGQR
jgi:hypothetical protein